MNPIIMGDRVRVERENLEPIIGVVHYRPVATGDCWIIVVDGDSTLGLPERTVNVQNYCRMTKLA